ncbi:MAG: sensor histidine kinase [Mangrovibacterium sp.]
MLLKVGLLLSMLFQLAAAVVAVSLVRRTKLNLPWILISIGLILMAVRRLFDFSTLFWDNPLFLKDTVNPLIGVLISFFIFSGVLFIQKIFQLQKQIDNMQAENEARVLKEVLAAEERARQRFARELHDGVGPLMASVKMTLSVVPTDKMEDFTRQLVGRSLMNTEMAIRSLKEVSNLLSPHLLASYGLESSLRQLGEQLFADSNVRFYFEPALGDTRYPENIEIHLYRIGAELMTNTLVHAQAETATLSIFESEGKLKIRYSDDGIGFDTGQKEGDSAKAGMGLANLESRVKSLKGEWQVTSHPGQGFLVEIQIPLQ